MAESRTDNHVQRLAIAGLAVHRLEQERPMARIASKPRRAANAAPARKAIPKAPAPVEKARRAGRRSIDLYYWPTPNGWKITIMLEECALPYRMILVDISKGDQFKPEFLAISPNNRMPASERALVFLGPSAYRDLGRA
jgi:Glutathione S-transferase, N-terminal domain